MHPLFEPSPHNLWGKLGIAIIPSHIQGNRLTKTKPLAQLIQPQLQDATQPPGSQVDSQGYCNCPRLSGAEMKQPSTVSQKGDPAYF